MDILNVAAALASLEVTAGPGAGGANVLHHFIYGLLNSGGYNFPVFRVMNGLDEPERLLNQLRKILVIRTELLIFISLGVWSPPLACGPPVGWLGVSPGGVSVLQQGHHSG